MSRLVVTDELSDELDALFETEEEMVGDIDFLLEQLVENIDVVHPPLFRSHNHYDHDPPFDITEVVKAKKQGYYVLRIKLWSSADGSLYNHRLMVGYDAKEDVFYALGIAKRNVAYDPRSPEWQALLDRYRHYISC